MNYKVSYKKRDSLPKLAWLTEIEKSSGSVTVFCGPCVECFDDFFVAGAWDGEFKNGDFDRSEVFFGTGCRISVDELIFCTPSHALERLVYSDNGKTLFVSNSLPFLMSETNARLLKTENQYERIFCSILDGPDKMIRAIPLSDGKTVEQVIVGQIRVHSDGSVTVEKRKKQAAFKDYDDYKDRLSLSLKRSLKNSNDPLREHTHYGIVTTLSSGYDSPACSSIAREVGCDTAVSLTGGRYDKDDGLEVAKQLGFNTIIRRNKDEYRYKKGNIDAEFLADGELGTGLQFSVFEDVFSDCIAVFGLRGSYWDRTASMTEGFEMVGYFNCESDASITENSLKNGYLVAPLPTFGASACNSIFSISNDPEMQKWSVGGDYDKPIPRRILETKGVRRDSFGQKKYGGGFSFSRDNKMRLKNRMSIDGYRDFIRFVSEGNGADWNLKRITAFTKYLVLNIPAYCNYVFAVLHLPFNIRQRPYRLANAGIVADLLFWGTDVMIEKYSAAMKGE